VGELVRRTFQVTLDVTVCVNEIDDALIESLGKQFQFIAADQVAESIARDQRLLAAILRAPEVLRRVLIQQVANSVESIYPEDSTLKDVQSSNRANTQMVEDLSEALPPEDVAFHRGTCKEGLFYDNSSYFQEAFTTHQRHFAVREVVDE
jgi:hypothetical protein